MAPDPIITKLLPQLNGLARGNRLEIDEFLADNAMTNLFLLALAAMQKDSLRRTNDGPDWKKYYALGAIHWAPGEDWDHVQNPLKNYCHHGTSTFPTWHRPYILLFETAVYEEMVRQADKFDPPWKKLYMDAAARFRLPYWDPIMPRWEKDTGPNPDRTRVWGCPLIFLQHSVFVRTPAQPDTLDKPENRIDNPLYTFRFPQDKEWAGTSRRELKIGDDWNKTFTERRPSPMNSKGEMLDVSFNKQLKDIKGISDSDRLLDAAVRNQAATLATQLWQMLHPDLEVDQNDASFHINEVKDWTKFANRNERFFVKGTKTYANVSLESWHDSIHGLIGTGVSGQKGHMGNPQYAGFEPMFWMHHNNIDRLLSLYQALYPTKYDTAFPKDDSSLVKLLPFRDLTGKKFYTSADSLVRDYRSPGFAMPGDVPSSDDMKTAIKAYLLKTYYWAANVTVKGQVKPTSLEGWPKKQNIDASEALQGTLAKAPETFAGISALAVDNGVAKLVAREVAVSESAILQETPISISSIVQSAAAVDDVLPKGTFEPQSQHRGAYMPTWNAHVKVRKYAFDGSFAVHLFVGDIEGANPNKYLTRKNEAGYSFVFAAPGNLEDCDNCKKQRGDDVVYEDVIPLTTMLYDYLESTNGSSNLISQGQHRTISDLTPAAVVPFLTEQLHWRMVDLGSTPLDNREREAGLEITVTSREFVPPGNDNLLGSYGSLTPYIDITRGKAGGYGHVYA